MTALTKPAPADAAAVESLRLTVAELSNHVRALEVILDEIRQDLVAAVRNDHLHDVPAARDPAKVAATAESAEEEAVRRQNHSRVEPPPPQEISVPPASVPSAKSTAGATPSGTSSKRTLKERLYDQPLYGEIVRLVGYSGIIVAEFQVLGKELISQYGQAACLEAAKVVTRIDSAADPPMLTLTEETRRHAWSLLGPDPRNPPWWSSSRETPPKAPASTKSSRRSSRRGTGKAALPQ